jgi:serine/threonine protein phosphatase PrpC
MAFVFQWIERTVGQIVAPDENYVPPSDLLEEASLWNVVAPDPRLHGPLGTIVRVPPSTAFRSPPSRRQVECENCHNLTPASSSFPSLFNTPDSGVVGRSRPVLSPEIQQVEDLVMQTVKDVARTMRSPMVGRKPENDVFQFCCNTATHTKNSDKLKKKHEKSKHRIKSLLLNDPSIFGAASARMGNQPPDGYSPLMAAALANNLEAAELLCQCGAPNQLRFRNLQGLTAIHIAAEQGHSEMVAFLKRQEAFYFGATSPPPVDLTGCTPYGVAMTSPEPKARKNRQQLSDMLYTPNDVSIIGTPAPVEYRIQSTDALQLVYGFGDMPGKRIAMEDAILVKVFRGGALFGVCDGHGDCGRVSEFSAKELTAAFEGAMQMSGNWTDKCTDICLAVDAKLRQTGLQGGSTAILALVTPTEIVVANVGDSRCILIQSKKGIIGLEQQMEEVSLEDYATSSSTSLSIQNCVVIPLSNDHKPSLAGEKARIEAAGLTVVEERFSENGQEIVIHKVALTETSLLATSRAFGDFEYKAGHDLTQEQQAVVAVPEVMVHQRNVDADVYLVLACDGIWDVMDNDQVATFVLDNIGSCQEDAVLPAVADLLLAKCLELGSSDNMSVIIVALSKAAEKISSATDIEGKTLDFSG